MGIKRAKWKSGGAGRNKGRGIWLMIICAGLLLGGNAARLTGQIVVRRVVRCIVNPVFGLTGYGETDTSESFWEYVLKEIMAVSLPLISYEGKSEAQETAVTDPVYEKYLSSEVLYAGGNTPILPGEKNETGEPGQGDREPGGESGKLEGENGEPGGENGKPGGENEGPGGENGGPGGENGEPGGENEGPGGEGGDTLQVSGGNTASHLPAQAAGSLYTPEQLRNFDYLVQQLYFVHSSTTVYPSQLDADTLLSKNLTIEKQEGKPQILIHHTHGTEAFSDSEEGQGKTILEVGDYLTELLTGYGYEVIHDRSIYSYDTAYSEASARVREILAANPSIQVVIDLHRDATGSMKRFVTELDGKPTAQLMFFNGMCQTADGPIDYLNNPYLEDNLAFSLQMKLIAEAYYPGLTRPNFLKAYQYNQHLMPRYTLVEAGSDTNTFDEVCRAMVPLAKILDAVLSDPDAVLLAGSR